MRNVVFVFLLLAVLPFWLLGMIFFLIKTGFVSGMSVAEKIIEWSEQ